MAGQTWGESQPPPPAPKCRPLPLLNSSRRSATHTNYSGYQVNIIGLKKLPINNNGSDTNSVWSKREWTVTHHVRWVGQLVWKTGLGGVLGTFSWEFHKHFDHTQNLFFTKMFYSFVSLSLFFHHTQLMSVGGVGSLECLLFLVRSWKLLAIVHFLFFMLDTCFSRQLALWIPASTISLKKTPCKQTSYLNWPLESTQ